jgi:DtxR family Mn-dependent transcriptional regulator
MEKTSRAIEDYLEALLVLEESRQPLEITTLANHLNVSKAAATQMMYELKDLGYIAKEKYGSIVLTSEGRGIGEKTYHRHKVIKELLLDLGVNETKAEEDCCHIEHVISEDTFVALEAEVERRKNR